MFTPRFRAFSALGEHDAVGQRASDDRHASCASGTAEDPARHRGGTIHDQTRDEDAVYIEAGEAADGAARFSLDRIAAAFEVDPERVRRALEGELRLGPDGRVDSKMAQHLAEVILGDLPLDRREAALMRLGAFTPRSGAAWGPGSGPPAEESDRQKVRVGVSDDELASKRASHDPATQPVE